MVSASQTQNHLLHQPCGQCSAWGKGWASAPSPPTIQLCPQGKEESPQPAEAEICPSRGSEPAWPGLPKILKARIFLF